jgi:hypothetical protein
MPLRRMFEQILQENDILGQPLYRLNQKPINAQPPKLRLPCLPLQKLIKPLILPPQPPNSLLPLLIIITVLKVYLEEGREPNNLTKDQLIVKVTLKPIPQLTIELLIQLLNLLNVREDDVHILDIGELEASHRVLKVTDDD